MNAVEEKYNDNPYHNCIHAADVVQSTHILLNAQSLEVSFVFVFSLFPLSSDDYIINVAPVIVATGLKKWPTGGGGV
ncbi:unnamed protein product [Trichobilharzia regenti]|nr:unnamed protein product [Trichobilharzia regenti]